MVEVQYNNISENEDPTALSNFSVIVGIPAFNEEKTIARVILEVQKYAHVVIVCDDGSDDMTAEIAERLGAVVIRHKRNFGYGAAMQSLFKRARDLKADILVTLDSDGQHSPSEIPQLVKPIEEGIAEVVLGSRFIEKEGTADMPRYRQLGIKIITKLANGYGKNGISDAQSGFRAYSKYALERLGSISENGMSASVELLRVAQKDGLKLCEVPISCKYTKTARVKTSSKNPFRHGVGLLMSIIKLVVEDRPLPLLGLPGAVSLAVGIIFGVWLMGLYSAYHRIITNVALASIAFILIGFFMVSTSITLYAIGRIPRNE